MYVSDVCVGLFKKSTCRCQTAQVEVQSVCALMPALAFAHTHMHTESEIRTCDY